jgi:D-alanyl-D-alanine carboxypeptidase/D-alanyl-D-alanine-endopeptidase (penicillin-binding protein 4)
MRHFAPSPPARRPAQPAGATPSPARRAALARLLAAGMGTLAAGSPAWAHALKRAAAATPSEVGTALLCGCGLPARCIGAYVRAIDDSAPLVAVNAESSFAMASTTKVVTSLAALDLLGADFRWRTFAFLRGPLLEGTLLGDLLIVGGGDARLTSAELREWFGELRTRGLARVAGDIVLDRCAFALTENDFANTPPPTTGRAWHVRPDAFAIDEGVLRVAVEPGSGRQAAVTLEPPLAGVQLANRVSMRGGCAASATLVDEAGSSPRVNVTGAWSAKCGRRELTLVPGAPAAFTTRAVAGLWAEAGGDLSGKVVERTHPAGEPTVPVDGDGHPVRPWAVHASDPLPVVLRDMNKSSDNVAARHLMLALTRGFPQRAATLAEAQARMNEWLARQGMGDGDIEVENGSGLSRGERAKPRALAQLLAHAWRAPQRSQFVDSLPVAGVDGTLEHRMQGTAAEGRAFLKTGTLLDTRALAGYVTGGSGKVYAVALMVNHPEADRAVASMDKFIEWVAKSA